MESVISTGLIRFSLQSSTHRLPPPPNKGLIYFCPNEWNLNLASSDFLSGNYSIYQRTLTCLKTMHNYLLKQLVWFIAAWVNTWALVRRLLWGKGYFSSFKPNVCEHSCVRHSGRVLRAVGACMQLRWVKVEQMPVQHTVNLFFYHSG